MSDKPEIPKPVAELAKDASQQGATQSKDAPGSRLKAWKKPHNLHAYYGPPPHTYMKLPDKNPNEQTADTDQSKVLPVTPMENGYSVPNYRPPGWVPPSEIQGPTRILDSDQGTTTHPGPTLSAVQEGKVPAVCEPHLQILCGPLLRYDTVKDGMWRGAVLIVTNDDESIYHPFPTLTLEWEMEDEKPFTLDPPFEDGKESGGPDPATEVVGSQGGDPIAASTSKTSTTVQSTKSGSSAISDTTAQRTSLEGLISDSDAPPTDSSSEDDANPKSVSDSGKTKSKSKHIRSFSGSGTWASSMMKKLKGIAAGGKDEFRGRPPERISKTKKESKEKQEWATKRLIEGEPIYKYAGIATTATFWRFILEVPVNPDPTKGMRAHYTINKPKKPVQAAYGEQGQTQLLSTITFHIAPTGSDMRFAAYSCNGFSEGIDPDNFKGEGFESGFDPVWADLLERHEQRPFHALVGGGDQLYCDSLMKEPELQEYVKLKTSEDKIRYPLTESIMFTMDRYYFNHYCLVFRNGCFARAISEIPMVNMLDDHDLIDGFGSYPEALQRSAFFKHIGSRGYFWFLLFQQFVVDTVDGTLIEPGEHTFKSTIIGADGPYIPFPSHSSLHWFGARTWLLMLDCRAERRKDLIVTPETYQRIFAILRELPDGIEHLIVQLGIPIAYPRMNLAEKIIHSDGWLAKISKAGYLPLSGLSNKYNKDMELLDDLSDHWTATAHKRERNWLILRLQEIALEKKLRISFVSGDVHLAAVGCFKTYPGKRRKLDANKGEVEPSMDHRWMVNIVSSAIVNTPPPPAAQAALNMLAGHKHRTLHYAHTDEVMIPVFQEGLRTESRRLNYVAGNRNYTIGERDPATGDLVFDIRVERWSGQGVTKGYVVRAPPPKWIPTIEREHKHHHLAHGRAQK